MLKAFRSRPSCVSIGEHRNAICKDKAGTGAPTLILTLVLFKYITSTLRWSNTSLSIGMVFYNLNEAYRIKCLLPSLIFSPKEDDFDCFCNVMNGIFNLL